MATLLKDCFPLALAPAVRAREPSVPLLQAILKEKKGPFGRPRKAVPCLLTFALITTGHSNTRDTLTL